MSSSVLRERRPRTVHAVPLAGSVSVVPAPASAPVTDAPDPVAPTPPASPRTRGPGAEPGPVSSARRRPLALPTVLVADLAVAAAGSVPFLAVGGSPVLGGVVVVTWPALVAGSRRRSTSGAAAGLAVRAGVTLGVLLLLVDAFARLTPDPRTLLLLALAVTFAGVVVGTLVEAGEAYAATRRPQPLLLVGQADQVVAAVTELHRRPGPWTPAAVCLLGTEEQTVVAHGITRLELLGDLDDVAGWLDQEGGAVLALAGPHLRTSELQRLGRSVGSSGGRLFIGTGLVDLPADRLRSHALGSLRVVHVRPNRAAPAARASKVVLERSAAAVGLVLLLPVLLAVAVAVRRDSPGPVLFRQTRVGHHGRPFVMLKFRTMHHGAEARRAALEAATGGRGVLFKIAEDPRVTPVGRALRRWSLDELPQLVNVVRGDMALVGPRPALASEVERYPVDMCRRLTVRPGITGLWQVSGRSDLSWQETMRVDLFYADNWSLELDLRILLRTFGAVLGRRGAY